MPKGVYKHKKGIYHTSEETKKKISAANIKNWADPNSKRNSLETRKKMSESRLKRKKRLGYLHSPEARKKISERTRGKLNPAYKGDNAGYVAIHEYMTKRIPKPKFCEKCKEKPVKQLANIGHAYRRNPKDWKWLCVKCHMIIDGRYEPFIKRLNKINAKRKELARQKVLEGGE